VNAFGPTLSASFWTRLDLPPIIQQPQPSTSSNSVGLVGKCHQGIGDGTTTDSAYVWDRAGCAQLSGAKS